MNRAQIYFLLLRLFIAIAASNWLRLYSLGNKPLYPALFLSVTLPNQVFKHLSKAVVSGKVLIALQSLVADRAFVLSINNFLDALLAESMATLGDIWVIKGLEADNAFSKLPDDLIYTDLHCLIILRSILLKAWLPLG